MLILGRFACLFRAPRACVRAGGRGCHGRLRSPRRPSKPLGSAPLSNSGCSAPLAVATATVARRGGGEEDRERFDGPQRVACSPSLAAPLATSVRPPGGKAYESSMSREMPRHLDRLPKHALRACVRPGGCGCHGQSSRRWRTAGDARPRTGLTQGCSVEMVAHRARVAPLQGADRGLKGAHSGGGARRLALPPAIECQPFRLRTGHFNRATQGLRVQDLPSSDWLSLVRRASASARSWADSARGILPKSAASQRLRS